MIAALPLQGASLPAAANHAALANTPSVNTAVDHAHVDQTAAHQTTSTQQQQAIPDDVEAFYTVGNDPLGVGFQPSNMNASNFLEMHNPEASHAAQGHMMGGSGSDYTNSSNLFTDPINALQKQGGPSDPLAMFKLQAQIIETTLNWSLYGQMASKAVSGIQSLFNNQV